MSKKKAVKNAPSINFAHLITSAFNSIPSKFNAKRNPANGRMLISNIPTQILADRAHSFNVGYMLPSGKVKRVKASEYMPAHDEGGAEHRAQAGKYFAAYRQGNFKSAASAEREFYNLCSYFIVCVSKGKLPNPDKRSGASTIRSQFIDYWFTGLKEGGITLHEIQVIGQGGRQITYTPVQFERVLAMFRDNAEDILNTWDNSVRAGKNTDFTI